MFREVSNNDKAILFSSQNLQINIKFLIIHYRTLFQIIIKLKVLLL